MNTAGDVLHARHLADRVGIGKRHRRRRPETGFKITEPLPCGRVIVLFHRIVFRVKGCLHHIVLDSIERVLQRFARITLVRDRLIALRLLRLPVAGADRDLVEAGGADLLLDRTLRARANCHHREHRGDAHRDAQHRERGLQAVAAERLQGDVDHRVAQQALH